MVNYTIINGTEAQLVDVNGGGTDVDALSTKDGVTLTNTELATLLTTNGVAVVKDQTGATSSFRSALLRVISTASKFASA